MQKLPLLLLALLLVSCVGKPAEPAPDSSLPDCPEVFVFAPGNYIMDIAGGAEVVLDPGVQEFPVFCNPQAARDHVNREVTAGRLSDGDWRIYRLDGDFEYLAQQAGKDHYTLKRMASATDWVMEK